MKKRLYNFSNNMKLYIVEEGKFKRFVIFNTKKFLTYINSNKIKTSEISKEEDPLDPIIGTIVIEQDSQKMSWITSSIAAKHGYGPLCYEIAMSNIYPQYLCPDDPSRVNDDARIVWKKFCSRKDISKKIKNKFEKTFKIINHPALTINNKYCLYYQYKINKKINYRKYLLNEKYIANTNYSRIEFEHILSDLASNFFIKNYVLLD